MSITEKHCEISYEKFKILLVENIPKLEKTCRYLYSTNSSANFDDNVNELVQNTLLVALEIWHNYTNSMGTWLSAIAKNLYLQKYYRKTKLEIFFDDMDFPAENFYFECTNHETIPKEDPLDIVKKLLNNVGENRKNIILMRMEGKSFKEISIILNKNEPNIKVMSSKTIKYLKENCHGKI